MYYAFDVWKDEGANFSFTHFLVSMFIAAHLIMDCRRTLPNLSNYRRRSQQLYSRNFERNGPVYNSNIRKFIYRLIYTWS